MPVIYIEAQGKTISELMTAISRAPGLTDRLRILAGRLAEPISMNSDGESKEIWNLTDGAYFCGVPVVDHITTVGLCQ